MFCTWRAIVTRRLSLPLVFKMDAQRIAKIEAHAEVILTLFLGLKERVALLKPMLHDKKCVAQFGAPKGRGFNVLRLNLFLSSIKDAVNLLADQDHRTPSIKGIVASLQDQGVRIELARRLIAKEEFAINEEYSAAERESRLNRKAVLNSKQWVEAENKWSALAEEYNTLQNSVIFKRMRITRDKVSAHSETVYSNGEYKLFEISELGVEWRDVENSCEQLQPSVALISAIVRHTHFAWPSFENMISRSASNFWNIGANEN
jgi:hypothetical protein